MYLRGRDYLGMDVLRKMPGSFEIEILGKSKHELAVAQHWWKR